MNGDAGEDYPDQLTAVDVLPASRSDALLSFVDAVHDNGLTLSVGKDRRGLPVRLDTRDRLEIVWQGSSELRAIAAELVEVQTGAEAKWHVRTLGRATRGQRRAAVRGPLTLDMHFGPRDGGFDGKTVDISEGGLHCVLDPPKAVAAEQADGADTAGPPPPPAPEVGTVVPLTVWLDDLNRVSMDAEVLRRHVRDDRRVDLTMRFVQLPERLGDIIRRYVFAGLHDMRARGLM